MDYFSVRLKSVEEKYPKIFQVYSAFELRCEGCKRFGQHDCQSATTSSRTDDEKVFCKDNPITVPLEKVNNDGGKPKAKRKRRKKAKNNGVLTSLASQEPVSKYMVTDKSYKDVVPAAKSIPEPTLINKDIKQTSKILSAKNVVKEDSAKLVAVVPKPMSQKNKTESFKILGDFLNKVNLEEVMVLVHQLLDSKDPRDRLDALCQHMSSIEALNQYKPL